VTFDPDKDPITPDAAAGRELSGAERLGLHLLRGLSGLGFVVCAFLVVGLTVNIAVAFVTSPFGLEGVGQRIDAATAELGPGDVVFGLEAEALVPFAVIMVYLVATVGLTVLPRISNRMGRRLANGTVGPKEETS